MTEYEEVPPEDPSELLDDPEFGEQDEDAQEDEWQEDAAEGGG